MANIQPISTRTLQKDGKWVERTRQTEILVCICGNKYIKTREKQTVCLLCLNKAKIRISR